MYKKQFLFLHDLGYEIQAYLDEETPVDLEEAREEYRREYHERSIYPTSVHKYKWEHEGAVQTLFGGIADAIGDFEARTDEGLEDEIEYGGPEKVRTHPP